jgi:Spy/CpxP family protein refolding chaperone
MRWTLPLLFVFTLITLSTLPTSTSAEQRPDGPPRQNGEGRGPQPGYHLLPRFVVEKMDLSDEQMQQIRQLEAETKAKLEKILTADQKKVLEEARPPRRGGGDSQGQSNGDRPRGGEGDNAQQGQRGPRPQRDRQ